MKLIYSKKEYMGEFFQYLRELSHMKFGYGPNSCLRWVADQYGVDGVKILDIPIN